MINLDKTQWAHYQEARRTPVIRREHCWRELPYIYKNDGENEIKGTKETYIEDCFNEWHPAARAFDAAKNLYTYAQKDNAKWDRDKKKDEKRKIEISHEIALAEVRANPVIPSAEIIGCRAAPAIDRGNHEGNSNHLLDHLAYIVTAIENGKFVLTVTANDPFNLTCKEQVYCGPDRNELKTVTLASTHYKKDDLKGAKYTFNSILLLDAQGKVVEPPKPAATIKVIEPETGMQQAERLIKDCKNMVALIPEIRKEDAEKPATAPLKTTKESQAPVVNEIDKVYLNAIIDKNWTLAEQLHRQKLAA